MFLPPVQPWRPVLQFWWRNWDVRLVLLRWRMWSKNFAPNLIQVSQKNKLYLKKLKLTI